MVFLVNRGRKGPGLIIGGRKMCVDPATALLYLAPGSACPPGG
jgi:hypothetical protein